MSTSEPNRLAGNTPTTPAAQNASDAQATPSAQPTESDSKSLPLAGAPPIVALGASAGGLTAFKQFFTALPPSTGLAYVLIQHLDPTHESLTAEILDRHTDMAVVQVTDEMPVEPDHVYVIPPDKYLTISGGTLHLSMPPERRGLRLPIDFFFRSLAQDQAQRAIGVVLTGTGSDGTLGAREIKAAGGMVMAQAPKTAQYDGMPKSIIDAGLADFVLPIQEMPAAILSYISHGYISGTAPQESGDADKDHLSAIVGLLHSRSKLNFTGYKKGTLTRRIARRMSLRHVHSLDAYLQLLRSDSDECHALCQDLLINVTSFFRDAEAWAELSKAAIKPLVHDHDPSTPIRAWVAGCATGEEAYSLAMLLTEACRESERGCDINIFASDVDRDALLTARAGVYPENIAAQAPADKLRQFFIKGDHTYRINKDIRDAVVFAEQNLISDPPFSKLDIITCRNLMIYLEPEVQRKILHLFHFALREHGILFLGNAETIGQQSDLFEPLSRHSRIYRRIGPVRQDMLRLPVQAIPKSRPNPMPPTPLPEDIQTRRWATLGQQILSQRFAPASVLINQKAQVLYLHGPVDDYLRLPSGEMGQDLIAMARQGLRATLQSAVHQAIQANEPVIIRKVRVRRGETEASVQLVVEPLREPGAAGLLLVSFSEAGSDQQSPRVVYVEQPEPEPVENPSTASEYEAVIRHLEDELAQTRMQLETAAEELATSSEEFKAANEEVTSINEELQSTNEELETSKEELQSVNEELQTVNSQLETKVNELEASTNDVSNLLMSIDYATLFLDTQFCIKQFTPAATRLLRIIKTDLGRPFADFARNISDPDLLSDAERVLTHLTPIEREISDRETQFLRRIVPYRTEDGHIGGVVITFTDITQAKKDFMAIHESQHRFTSFMKHLPGLAWIKDLQGRYVYANDAALKAFGRTDTALYGRTDDELFPPETAALYQQHDREAMSSAAGIRVVESLRHADGRMRPSIMSKFPIPDVNGKAAFIAGMAVDITDRIETEQALRQAREQLEMITNSMAVGVAQCDRDLKYVWVNAAYAQRHQRTLDDIVGRSVQEVLGDKAFEVIEPYIEQVLTGQRVSFEREIEYAKLGRRWAHVDDSPTFDSQGSVDGFVAVVRDTTEAKAAEQALRESEARKSAVLSASLDAIISIDNHGVILDWNPAAEQIFGMSRADAVGQNVAKLVLPESLHAQCQESMTKLLSTGEGPALGQRIETTVRRADGTEFAAEVALVKIDLEGPPIFEGFVRDITERKRIEAELQRMTASLERLVADRTRRLRDATARLLTTEESERRKLAKDLHDSLCQELVVIKMKINELEMALSKGEVDKAGPLIAAALAMVDQATRSSRLMIGQLSPPALYEAGLIVAVKGLADQFLEHYKLNVDLSDVEQDVVVPDEQTRVVAYRSVRELLINCAKYAKVDEAAVSIRQSGENLLVSVSDHGCGFDPARTSEGYGLFMTRERIENLGGTMNVDSKPNDHTTITLTIPLRPGKRNSGSPVPADSSRKPRGMP